MKNHIILLLCMTLGLPSRAQTGYYYQILTDKEGRTKFTIEKAASVKDGTGYDTNGISCGKAFPTADHQTSKAVATYTRYILQGS